MTYRFANRLATEPRFAVIVAPVIVAAGFAVGMTLAAIVHALIG